MLYNYGMYTVISKIGNKLHECATLEQAMRFAKDQGGFVTITGPDFEVCGIFGVDTIKDGKCPDGIDYDWNKSSRIGRVKKEHV
jgi:hypothetical protein